MDLQHLYAILKENNFRLSTDSRLVMPRDVYLALRGEKFDGNAHAVDALEKGAVCAIIDRPEYKTDDRYIVVNDSLRTLNSLAALHRQTFFIPILAIGGSNGKTTTKELIHAVLSKQLRVHTTEGNLNNEIGVPMTLLSMPQETEIGIIEIGANHPSEHIRLMETIRPTHVLVTNNGADHLEGFGSLNGVRRANKEIFDESKKFHAHAFVNKNLADLVEDSATLDRTLYPEMKVESLSTTCASLRYKNEVFSSELFGSFNETNILAAITVGEYFKIPLTIIQEAVTSYQPTLKRSQIISTNNFTAIIDCYNANPTSMMLSVASFLDTTTAGKRMLVIGDMLEMGEFEATVHRKFLENIHKNISADDIVIFVGPRFYKNKEEYPLWHFFETTDDAREFFNSLSLEGKSIFVKGSRGIALENVIKEKIPLG